MGLGGSVCFGADNIEQFRNKKSKKDRPKTEEKYRNYKEKRQKEENDE